MNVVEGSHRHRYIARVADVEGLVHGHRVIRIGHARGDGMRAKGGRRHHGGVAGIERHVGAIQRDAGAGCAGTAGGDPGEQTQKHHDQRIEIFSSTSQSRGYLHRPDSLVNEVAATYLKNGLHHLSKINASPLVRFSPVTLFNLQTLGPRYLRNVCFSFQLKTRLTIDSTIS